MKKVLVTGANGFLGANLCRMLYNQGYEVSIFVRKHAALQHLEDVPCKIIYGNVDQADEVAQAVAGQDIVVHAASITAQHGVSFDLYERVNVVATSVIVDACLQHRVSKFIYVSTANTIAPGSMQEPGTELNGFALFKANSGYINTKYLAQQYVLEQVMRHSLPAVVVNPTFMIGPNDNKPSSGQMILYGLNKKVIFYPSGGKNFVHILDVCQGIVKAIEVGKPGSCYLLAGENLSYASFFSKLNKVAGQKPVMIKIPAVMLKLGAALGSLVQRWTRKPQRLTRSAAYMLCLNNYYSGKKSELELQMRYRTVDEAIAEAYHWFHEQGMVAESA